MKESRTVRTLGHHSLIELSGCDPEKLKRVGGVRRAMLEAARRANGTIVKAVFHAFSPWGVSGVVVIAESHLTIHTWPEHGYAAVDVFSCSPKLQQSEVRGGAWFLPRTIDSWIAAHPEDFASAFRVLWSVARLRLGETA